MSILLQEIMSDDFRCDLKEKERFLAEANLVMTNLASDLAMTEDQYYIDTFKGGNHLVGEVVLRGNKFDVFVSQLNGNTVAFYVIHGSNNSEDKKNQFHVRDFDNGKLKEKLLLAI